MDGWIHLIDPNLINYIVATLKKTCKTTSAGVWSKLANWSKLAQNRRTRTRCARGNQSCIGNDYQVSKHWSAMHWLSQCKKMDEKLKERYCSGEEEERRNSEGEEMQSERVWARRWSLLLLLLLRACCLDASATVWSGASPARPLARALASLTGTLYRNTLPHEPGLPKHSGCYCFVQAAPAVASGLPVEIKQPHLLFFGFLQRGF